MVLADGPPCTEQPGHGKGGFHPGGRHPAGGELVFGFVAGARNVGAMVALGVAVTAGDALGLGLAGAGMGVEPGVAVTVGDALGPGVGSVGETPKAAEVSPAINTRLSRTDAPRRVTRADAIALLAFSGHATLPHAAARTPNQTVDLIFVADIGPTSPRRPKVTISCPYTRTLLQPDDHSGLPLRQTGRARLRLERHRGPATQGGAGFGQGDAALGQGVVGRPRRPAIAPTTARMPLSCAVSRHARA
jgi:hypothetical protein